MDKDIEIRGDCLAAKVGNKWVIFVAKKIFVTEDQWAPVIQVTSAIK
jgi:hypothetical protein